MRDGTRAMLWCYTFGLICGVCAALALAWSASDTPLILCALVGDVVATVAVFACSVVYDNSSVSVVGVRLCVCSVCGVRGARCDHSRTNFGASLIASLTSPTVTLAYERGYGAHV